MRATSGVLWLLVTSSAWRVSAQTSAGERHAGLPAAEAQPLTYDEALRALELAPELRARSLATAQLRAAKRDVTGLPSDLLLSVEAGPRVSPGVAAQGRVGVTQGFALASLGAARRDVVEAHAVALDAERLGLRMQRRIEVGQAWLRVHTAHAALQIAQAELTLADELARATERSAQLAELTRADAADATAYAAEAKLGLLAAEGELTDARLDLTRALAVSDRVLDVNGQPPVIAAPTPELERALHAAIEHQPALKVLARKLGVLDARARELRAQYASQLSLGVVVDRSDPPAWAVLGNMGLTLPMRDRSARDRAELASERTALLGDAAEQRAALHVELERSLHEIHHTHEILQHAEERLLPAVEQGLAARETLLRAGEGSVLEIILARRNALALRLRRLKLQEAWLSALVRFRELADAVGVTA